MSVRRSMFAIAVLLLAAFPALAGDCDNPIRSFTAPDGVTGMPIRLQWSLGGVIAQSLTLTGHDFEEPVILGPGQTSFPYVPDLPGEKHATLNVVTECGTFTREIKYHVQQCNVMMPMLAVDQTTVAAGGTVTASIDLLPGHTARWVVRNGTASSTEGGSIQITAAASGIMRIDVFVKRGNASSNSCEVRATRVVTIQPACAINPPVVWFSTNEPAPDSQFNLFLPALEPGETATFQVEGATVLYSDGQFLDLRTPSSGSFTVTITVSKPGCTKSFPYTFEVTPCAPIATVSAAPGSSCEQGTIVVDFAGTAPFQGYWNDGQYFFTESHQLERTVTAAGVYTITHFADSRCTGTISGEAVVGAALPRPMVVIEEIVNGGWYGPHTCPGMTRMAYMTTPIPAGAEVVWSIENGTILSGQGTSTIEWSGTNPGSTVITAVFRTADGCMSQVSMPPYALTLGQPEVSVTVEPSVIDAGGTAIVKVTRLNDYVGGWNVYSSLGDLLYGVGPVDQYTYAYEYRSTQGAGVATITVDALSVCGLTDVATATLTINQGGPVHATATVKTYGSGCDAGVYAELTGVAPFSGTWSNGQTFTIDYPYAYLYPVTPGTHTLVSFSDANGPGTITGSGTLDYVELPAPQIAFDNPNACPNSVVTATITSEVPEDATITWIVYDGTIISGQGTPSIQIQMGPTFGPSVNVRVTAPGACSPYGFNAIHLDSWVQPPLFTLYNVYDGGSTDIYVTLDPKTADWSFENSLGDPMELIGPAGWENTYIVRYTSTHGVGETTVRVFGTTTCGVPFETSQVMTVVPQPPTATLTYVQNESCGATVTATLTGTAPYTVTWGDTGETLTTSETTLTHFVGDSRSVYLSVTDVNGALAFSNWLWVEAKQAPFVSIGSHSYVCPNTTTTFTAYGLPEGATPNWYLAAGAGRIVSGQGTSELVVEALETGWLQVGMSYVTAEGCSGYSSGAFIQVLAPSAQPVITLPVTSINNGEFVDFTVTFDGNYQSLNWESSNGDPVFNTGQNGMTFNLRYLSQNGPGTVTIRAYGTTLCGQQVEATATLTINP